MGEPVEGGEAIGVGEHDAGQGRPVDRPVRPDHAGPEVVHDGLVGGPVRLEDLPGDRVGIHDGGASSGQAGGHR